MPDAHELPERSGSTNPTPPARTRKSLVPLLMLAIVLLAILRSTVATHLDSFTVDENYHITAGVSYVRTGDYRINPEHPPLVKLWVGAFMPKSMFALPPLQVFNDKPGERTYCAETVFLKNDPDRIQRHSRLAMYCFNGILLFVFALVARRVFGSVIAIGALLFLAVDPTVAAHMPVVMTDLPITLTSAIALLCAWLAFNYWQPRYLFSAAAALGLTLATKHSGIIIAEVIVVFGLIMSLRKFRAPSDAPIGSRTRGQRLFAVLVVLLGAWLVLWSTYRFRYTESYTPQETFNRPLADKINDLESPRHRWMVSTLARFHLFPRSYIWGFADIIRAGVEGRGYPIYFMNHVYASKKPLYFFPIQILVKVPLGLLLIALTGLALFLARKFPPAIRSPYWLVFCFTLFFLLTLAVSNSFYAGVRHAMPAYPALALFAGAAIFYALETKSFALRSLLAIAALWACISAIPILRPWEYHNALAGGTAHAYRHFSDEGIDLGLRTKEFAAYYHSQLEPKGELPLFVGYLPSDEEEKARGIHTLNEKWESGEIPDNSSKVDGTIIVEAIRLTPRQFAGMQPLLQIEPNERFGNLLIFRGSFDLPILRATRLFFRGLDMIYSPKGGPDKAAVLFQQCVELNPVFFPAWIELGNYHTQRGERDAAVHAFEFALKNSPDVPAIRQLLTEQIRLIQTQPNLTAVHPVRDPFLE